MFCVIFEVQPRPELRDTYFAQGRLLRPELEQIDGFVDNIRYASLTRAGWVLSLSGWRDEKALVRWRTHARHHETQSFGRSQIFLDYHLRVGEVVLDTRIPAGQDLRQQRLDETAAGAGTTVTLLSAFRPDDPSWSGGPEATARWLGLEAGAPGLLSWDVFGAVLAPDDLLLLLSWKDAHAAEVFETERRAKDSEGGRLRRVRVVRDYGMFDRREAPQYFPEANDARVRVPT
jgi:heme-degrading monooxygenase HmoA